MFNFVFKTDFEFHSAVFFFLIKIPLDFIKTLNNYSTTDLLARFVEGEEENEEVFLQGTYLFFTRTLGKTQNTIPQN